MLHKFSFRNSPCKILTKRGGGRLGFSWSVTKSVAKQKAKLKKFICENFLRNSQAEHTKIQSRFLLQQLRWLPLKWLILSQNETQHTLLEHPSLPYWVFYPYSQSLYGRQTYAIVITKFSGIGRLPFCISYCATLRAFRVLSCSTIWKYHSEIAAITPCRTCGKMNI